MSGSCLIQKETDNRIPFFVPFFLFGTALIFYKISRYFFVRILHVFKIVKYRLFNLTSIIS